MLKKFLSNIVYVKIYPNRFDIKTIEQESQTTSYTSPRPFSTERLLVGQFSIAAQSLKQGLTQVSANSIFMPKPIIVIQPMEKTSGGLSELEKRALQELASVAGARKVIVWVGQELSDAEVLQKVENS